MRSRRLILGSSRTVAIFAVAMGIALPGLCDVAKEKTPPNKENRVICGPRCVQFVLKYYGQQIALGLLVREMQGTDQSNGTTVRRIVEAVQSRGLYARTIQLKNTYSFQPKAPAIVHLREENDDNDNIVGHFVVVVPECTLTDATVWDGLLGMDHEPWAVFSKKMTGVVVLTGNSPIDEVNDAIKLQGADYARRWIYCLLGALVLGAVFLLRSGRRSLRRFSRGASSRFQKEKVI